jgi:Putative peptidoglycan binding domain
VPPGARRLHWGEPDAELVAVKRRRGRPAAAARRGCDDYKMSRRDDSDDWFAESAREPRRPHDEPPTEDDWVRDDIPVTRAPRRASLRGMPRGGQIALGAGAIAALLLVLWAAGAFGGGGSPPTRPVTTTTQARPTTASPAPASAQPPATTLTPGNSGRQVKRLQRALAQLGYSPGRVDGSYGPATENALKRFQQANGLQPDGVLGPKTLKALKQKLAAA